MTLNSFNDSLSIDFNERESSLTLNHIENYLSSLVSQLDNDLSYLQSDESFASDSLNYSSSSSLIKYTQPDSPISCLTTPQCRISYYENNDDYRYNLLTATQIQKIVSIIN